MFSDVFCWAESDSLDWMVQGELQWMPGEMRQEAMRWQFFRGSQVRWQFGDWNSAGNPTKKNPIKDGSKDVNMDVIIHWFYLRVLHCNFHKKKTGMVVRIQHVNMFWWYSVWSRSVWPPKLPGDIGNSSQATEWSCRSVPRRQILETTVILGYTGISYIMFYYILNWKKSDMVELIELR